MPKCLNWICYEVLIAEYFSNFCDYEHNNIFPPPPHKKSNIFEILKYYYEINRTGE